MTITLPTQDVRIIDCNFEACHTGIHIDNSSQNCAVESCTFYGGIVQLVFTGASTGSFHDCFFAGAQNYGAAMNIYSSVSMERNFFAHCPGGNLTVWAQSTASGADNILLGGDFSTLYFTGDPIMDFHDNHILNGGDYTVRCAYTSPPHEYHIDLTDNYWGTTDAEQISEWIFDAHDSAEITMIVDFEPFLGQPVATEEKSWSDVKALYR